MPRYRISSHLTVGGLDLKPSPERERRIATVMQIVNDGLASCKKNGTLEEYSVERQLRPWNESRRDGEPEPDIAEYVTIVGVDLDAVFVRYRDDPGHVGIKKALEELGWATWKVVVSEMKG